MHVRNVQALWDDGVYSSNRLDLGVVGRVSGMLGGGLVLSDVAGLPADMQLFAGGDAQIRVQTGTRGHAGKGALFGVLIGSTFGARYDAARNSSEARGCRTERVSAGFWGSWDVERCQRDPTSSGILTGGLIGVALGSVVGEMVQTAVYEWVPLSSMNLQPPTEPGDSWRLELAVLR